LSRTTFKAACFFLERNFLETEFADTDFFEPLAFQTRKATIIEAIARHMPRTIPIMAPTERRVEDWTCETAEIVEFLGGSVLVRPVTVGSTMAGDA
jgi:hypothetical protein